MTPCYSTTTTTLPQNWQIGARHGFASKIWLSCVRIPTKFYFSNHENKASDEASRRFCGRWFRMGPRKFTNVSSRYNVTMRGVRVISFLFFLQGKRRLKSLLFFSVHSMIIFGLLVYAFSRVFSFSRYIS